ncbi:lipopolysaccharide biosynthesis protein RfbH [Thermodesulfobacterium sp. TA1]|nr:lipopolysaccharide biosynthesis protein RfbH [Thermodesulfobacterium sp. TA1]
MFDLTNVSSILVFNITKKFAKINENKVKELFSFYSQNLAKNYYKTIHSKKHVFKPGESKINYAQRIFDEKEIYNLLEASLEFWLTEGRYCEEFEKRIANFLEVKHVILVNSGSSANLLAFMALTSHELGEKRIKRGDEVITTATAFPTTISPIIQYGAIPVFVDIELPTYNIDCKKLKKALSKKTKAIMLAHTLGNPFNIEEILSFCYENDLWLIEDNCDALGSRYFYKNKWKYTGNFGHLATLSFYPAHQITTGEGGAVLTNDDKLAKIVRSLRDWGRDCWCKTGQDNTCKKRFKWKLGELPYGYDHKYIYSRFGYNLKMTELQASIGCAQIEKLPFFIKRRKENWQLLKDLLSDLSNVFILPEPTPNSDPCWFGFLLTIKNDKKILREKLVKFLENNKIQTRGLFAGNILKHPCFKDLQSSKKSYKIIDKLNNSNKVLLSSFWIGVSPGITEEMIYYMTNKIKEGIKVAKA